MILFEEVLPDFFLVLSRVSIRRSCSSYRSKGLSLRKSFRRRSENTSDYIPDDLTLGCGLESLMDNALPARSSSLLPPPPLEKAVASVGEGVATTVYEIVRPATIPSDNIEHKVTVGLIDVKPTICYTCVPKRVPQAYMIAKVVNASAYTFLRGETSIFLDNTFVCKGTMKDVFPQEEFECSLGVDPGIKVTYKPLKKYKAASGIFSKVTSTTYEQVTEVKNTHDYAVKLLITDQFPRSSDERIKVSLLEPVIDTKHPEKNKEVTLNKQNNIEWNLDLPEKGTKELLLKYVIEHPSQMTLQTNENFQSA